MDNEIEYFDNEKDENWSKDYLKTIPLAIIGTLICFLVYLAIHFIAPL